MNRIPLLFKKIIPPPRFAYIKKFSKNNDLNVLDVGCGSNSNELSRLWLKVKQYDGIDKEQWNGDANSYLGIENLYDIDLESTELLEIQDNFYDVIILSHVIEHVANGLNIISILTKKMKSGAVIYIETPSSRTINFPSAVGFLNFYDDNTHRKLYFDSEVIPILQNNDCIVRFCGFRRDWIRIILISPVSIFLNLFYFIPFKKTLCSWGMWDLLGVARVWVGQKR
jgi:SAM-dependent methyltransferase